MKYQKGFSELGNSGAVSGPFRRKACWKENVCFVLGIVAFIILLGLVGKVAG